MYGLLQLQLQMRLCCGSQVAQRAADPALGGRQRRKVHLPTLSGCVQRCMMVDVKLFQTLV